MKTENFNSAFNNKENISLHDNSPLKSTPFNNNCDSLKLSFRDTKAFNEIDDNYKCSGFFLMRLYKII